MAVKEFPVVTPVAAPVVPVPPLEAGDRLSRQEFHHRYLQHPEIKKAELIDGVVYMPSPVRLARHGEPHAHMVAWLAVYAATTPGLRIGDNATVILGRSDEVQTDAMLLIDPTYGGQTRETPDGYLDRAPELAVEIAASSASYDMHVKREAYRRAGVLDYVVLLTHERRVLWLQRVGDTFVETMPDDDGIYRSRAFPGLWLDPAALLAGDLAAVLATVQVGVASPEHAAFVADLGARAG